MTKITTIIIKMIILIIITLAVIAIINNWDNKIKSIRRFANWNKLVSYYIILYILSYYMYNYVNNKSLKI